MEEKRKQIVWPGFGLNMGASGGMLIGVLFFDTAGLAPAIGAGLGLVIGAIVGSFTRL